MNARYIQWRNSGGQNFSTVIAGDFCPREENCQDLVERVDEITSQIKPFFENADLRLLQWECAVTRQDTPIDKSGPNHRCYPECAVFAQALGIDAVLLANNHTGDYGVSGIKDTLDLFEKLHIHTVGAGMSAEAAACPLRLNQNGLTVSIINAAENEFGIAYGNIPGANGFDPLQLASDIRKEKTECDLVIVALHGGHEMYPFPTPRLRRLCRLLAEFGADAIFNCHTHCPAGYEIYHGVPIIYSPGNFYFPGRPTSLPCWYVGYLPKFFFDKKGAFALELLPYFNKKQSLTLLDEDDTGKFFTYLDELTSPISDEFRLQKLFDAWCVRNGTKGYFGTLFNRELPKSFQDRNSVMKNLDLRNLLTCQSHHDLLRNTLLLMERYAMEDVAKLIPFINTIRNPEWIKIDQ